MALLRRRTKTEIPHAGPYAPGWEVPARFNFTRDVIDNLAADPTRSAMTFVDREGIVDRRSFHELSGDAARWAHLLRTRLDRGDRVLFAIGKVPEWHGAMLGALKSGLVSVPSPDMLRARDLAFRAQHSGARLVVAARSLEGEIEEMRHQVGANVSVLYLDEAVDELRRYMPVAPTEDTMAGETAFILYTSGTTKDPKGVVHTHAYTWAQRAQAAHWLDAHEGDVVWCTASTGWAKAIWNSLLGPWSHGAEIVLHEGPFDAEERVSLLQRLGVTVLCQAPTEYRMLAKLENLGAAHLPRLRHAVSAGEPLNPEVIARFQDALGLTIYDGYGQTENSLLVANTPDAPLRPGSMGVPTPGHDVAVIDEVGNVCPAGVEGELALIGRPPTLFVGYWDAPEETEAAFRDGWYLTGDRGVRDEDGYLWFVGRSDDVILSAAYRIGPFEVESALLEHPAVAESGVVGVPDLDRGQIVKAFVVLRPGHEPGDRLARELQEHVKAVTAPYKYPRAITFVDELPKTSSGKIRRNELRRLNDELGVSSPRMSVVPDAPEVVEEAEAPAADAVALEEAARLAAAAAAERARAEAVEAARRETEAAAERARLEAEVAAQRARADAEERARREAEETARMEAEAAERARADAEAAERARAEAEAAEAARREAEEAERARADAEAAERARREAEEAERARAEAEEAERARAEAEAAERAQREAEEAERARADAEAAERAQREAEEAERARAEAEAAEQARTEAEAAERARAEAEAAERAQREAEAAERARAEAEAAEQAQREAEAAERARAEAEAAEQAQREAEAAERARAEAEAEAAEQARREAEDAERARAEAEAAEQARREAEDAERARAEAEAWARIEAAEEAARRAEEEEAAAAAALAAAPLAVDDDESEEEDALGSAELGEAGDARESRGDARRRRREEKAEAKRLAEEERRRAKEAEEQRKRDEAAAREDAKRRAEEEKIAAKQRVEDEKRRAVEEKEAAKRRAEEERIQAKLDAEQRKRQEVAAREAEKASAKQAAEDERRRQAAEREGARLAEDEERRQARAAAKAGRGGLGRLFKRDVEDEFDDDDDDTPVAPIPDIVERLRVYSRDTADAPPAADPEVGAAELEDAVGDDPPSATRSLEGE